MAKAIYEHAVYVKSNRDGVMRQFPIDMLRRDGLVPSAEHDSGLISASFTRERFDEAPLIKLVRTGERAWFPTVARWESYGYEVVEHNVQRAI